MQSPTCAGYFTSLGRNWLSWFDRDRKRETISSWSRSSACNSSRIEFESCSILERNFGAQILLQMHSHVFSPIRDFGTCANFVLHCESVLKLDRCIDFVKDKQVSDISTQLKTQLSATLLKRSVPQSKSVLPKALGSAILLSRADARERPALELSWVHT